MWLLLNAISASAQFYTGTVTSGAAPAAVAANPVTDMIYVANKNSNNVTVINGATNATTTVTDPNANTPDAIAVNPVTNKIYVANSGSNNVTVIDGATNSITDVSAASQPYAIAVNPITNMIYVVNLTGNNVTVINGATNATSTVSTGATPTAVAVNPVTNMIYVTNDGSGTVSVINGATNTVAATVTVGTNPAVVAVNPVTNTIYVSNLNSTSVSVINGATNTVAATVGLNGPAYSLAVNPVSNMIYAPVGSEVGVIDGSTNTVSNLENDAASDAIAVAVDSLANKIYVANASSNNVTVIDGVSDTLTTISDPNASGPGALAVNPVTDKIFVANTASNNVSVFDGANYSATTVTDPNAITPSFVAVNPATNTAYITNSSSNNVTVITGTTYSTTVTAGNGPSGVAVNPATSQIYVANYYGNNVTVIDGATNTTNTITDPNATSPQAVAVNPVTNLIYVANNGSSNVTVINGATDTVVATVTDPNASSPSSVAVNPVTNTAYVANSESSNVTVITGSTYVTTIAVGSTPDAIAVNPATDMIYTANSGGGDITVINGVTNATTTVTDTSAAGPSAIAVNPSTNMIYVANSYVNSDFPSAMTVINGATNAVTSIDDPNANDPNAIAVNTATNKIYMTSYNSPESGNNNVTVVDGATNAYTDINLPTQYAYPTSVAVNPVTGLIYIADSQAGDSVNTVFAEQQVQTIPIVSNLTPLTNNETTSVTPAFNFTTSNSFTTSPVDNLLFQVDTWQSPWLAGAAQGGGNFSGATSTLQPGFHILYAYSTEGEEATSTNTGLQSSPLIGNITAYGFLVTAPEATAAPASLTFGNQAVGTPSTSQAVTVTNSGSAPLVISNVGFTGTNAAEYSETDTCISGSPIAPGGVCTINVTFTPTAAGTSIANLMVTDNSTDVPGSQQTVTLAGAALQASTTTTVTSSSNPSVYGQTVTYTAAVTPQGVGSPTGTVTFYDGTSITCAAMPVSANQATCSTAVVVLGPHSITAVYSGDPNFAGSTSVPLTQTVIQAGSTTTLISSANPSVTGQSVTFTATVIAAPPASGSVNGTVTFDDGTTPLCTGVTLSASGQGQCAVSNLTLGTHAITAIYSGNADFLTGTSPLVSQVVGPPSTSTRIAASTPNPSVVGQSVTVSFAVAVNAPGTGTIPATDTVTVSDGTGVSCTASLATGSCALSPKAAGADSFTAAFAGDANFAASTSAAAPQTVNAASTTTTITATSPNAPALGQAITVSFQVSVNAPGVGTIPGTDTVMVADGSGASCTATLAAGKCSLTPKALGSDSLTATFNGDANFSGSSGSTSTSLTILQTVNLTGLSGTTSPDQPTSLGVSLNSPATTQLNGTLTLTFTSSASGTAAGYIDPMTCFINSSNQCVTQLNFTIPAGATAATLPNSGAVQQGTTAGTITVTLTSLTAGGTSVLPQPAPSLSLVVPPIAPVLKSVSITNVTSSGFDVVLTAYSTPRNLQNVTFSFAATSGDNLNGSSPQPISLSTLAQTYFSGASGASGGGTFVLTVPFSYSGNTNAIGSVTATLSNSVGTSTSLTGNVQ